MADSCATQRNQIQSFTSQFTSQISWALKMNISQIPMKIIQMRTPTNEPQISAMPKIIVDLYGSNDVPTFWKIKTA